MPAHRLVVEMRVRSVCDSREDAVVAMKAGLHELTAMRKRLQQRQAREKKKSSRRLQMHMCIGHRLLAFRLDSDMPLRAYSVKKVADISMSPEDFQKRCTESFLSLGDDAVLDLRRRDRPITLEDRLADQFLSEQQCVQWISELNRVKGVTPDTHMVAEYRQLLKRGELTASSNTVLPGNANAKQRKWVSRFRKKWRVRRGKPLERDVLAPSLMKEKVTWASRAV